MPTLPLFTDPIVYSFQAASGPTEFQRLDVDGFSPEKQMLSNWCWAAVTRFVAYAIAGRDVRQCEVVRACQPDLGATAGGLVCCPPQGGEYGGLNIVFELERAIRHYAAQPTYVFLNGAKLSSIRNRILGILAANRPVPIAIKWDNGYFHFICIFGRSGSGSRLIYHVYDPAMYDDGDNDPIEYITERGFDVYQGFTAMGAVMSGCADGIYVWDNM